MSKYTVQWTIQIDADSPREAAETALKYQRDPDSEAVVFEVTEDQGHGRLEGWTIDLAEPEALPLGHPESELPCYCGRQDCPRCGLA